MQKFWLNCLLATAFVFFFMWALSKITELKMFNAFDPIGQALGDLELTDYAFAKLRPLPLVEERVVLVNIGLLPRAGIAEQIRIISKYKPKVIGIDSFFYCEGNLRDSVNCPELLDTMGNLLLSNAIQEAGNVVLVSKLHQTKSVFRSGAVDVIDSIAFSDSVFQNFATVGYANLTTNATYQEDVKDCRSFPPRMVVNGTEHLAFAVQMAMLYDSVQTRRFLARGHKEELVNYRGNVEFQETMDALLNEKAIAETEYPVMFTAIDVKDVLTENFDEDVFKDKIVILGFLGSIFGDPAWNDKFFTPLNKKIAGRANPDMFGVVVHANIVSMILNGDYIDQLEEHHKYLIAFIFCYLNMALFFYINAKIPIWFDSVSLLIQVLQIVLLMGATILIFTDSAFKLDLTLTIGVIALAGPCFGFYDNILTTLVRNWQKRLTNRRNPVLRTQNQDIS
jgi:CHASE2 domain-containing sensor protein